MKKGARAPSRNDGTLSRRPSKIITEGISDHRLSRKSGFEEYGITASCPASAYGGAGGRPSRASSSVDEEEDPADRKRRRSLTFGPRSWSTSSKATPSLNLPGAIGGGDSLKRSAASTPSITSQGTAKSTHLTVPV